MAKTQRPKRNDPRRQMGIRDRLGRLTYQGACRLLGDDGKDRLRKGGRFEINLPRDVFLGGDTLRVSVPDYDTPERKANVTIVEMTNKPRGLHLHCEQCANTCDHIAAVLGMVLEEKLTLGLSAPPDETEPVENLTEEELLRRAVADRQHRADTEKMRVKSFEPDRPWTCLLYTSPSPRDA